MWEEFFTRQRWDRPFKKPWNVKGRERVPLRTKLLVFAVWLFSPRERQNLALTPIQSLCVAGEMVGGLFSFNYPGGTGLIPGAVFGRTADPAVARSALDRIAG